MASGGKSATLANVAFVNFGTALLRRKPETSQPEAFSRTAFMDSLYRDHWDELCGHLRKKFGSGPPEAEDLAQAAFTKISAIKDLSSIEHPRAFLFRTAVNLGLNATDRQKTARNFIDQALQEAGDPILEQNSPETVFSNRQHIALIEEAMKGLSDKQRTIIVRNRLNGESYREIADAEGWSKADISRQLTAALEILQKSLRETGDSMIVKSGHEQTVKHNRRKTRSRRR